MNYRDGKVEFLFDGRPTGSLSIIESKDLYRRLSGSSSSGIVVVDKGKGSDFITTYGSKKEFVVPFISGTADSNGSNYYIEIQDFKATPDNIIYTPSQNITLTAKVPSLDVDFSVKAGMIELPYKTTYANTHIVTLKAEVYLEHEAEKRKLSTRVQSLPVLPIVGPDRLKERPRIRPQPEDIAITLIAINSKSFSS